jgi:hypothetical protein
MRVSSNGGLGRGNRAPFRFEPSQASSGTIDEPATRVLFPLHGKAEARWGLMSAHKYKIGQFVNYNPRSKPGTGIYQVVQLMPPVDDEPQYRIKSEAEGRLRSAMESELTALNRR